MTTAALQPARLYPDVEADNRDQCRICLECDVTDDDPLIAPCRCAGTTKWVHRKCLNEWRSQEQVPLAFSHCPQCRYQYRTELVGEQPLTRRVKLLLFVARDTIGVFMVLQAIIACTAVLVHVIDSGDKIAEMWENLVGPWAVTHAASHLAIGPYYVSTFIGYLAILGFVGIVLACSGRLPSTRREARHPARRRPRQSGCCENGCPTCDSDGCFWCRYVGECCANCQCGGSDCTTARATARRSSCHCSERRAGGSTPSRSEGDGAQAFLVVGLVLLVVLVVAGLVVGVFFSVIVVQRIVQRHVRLLHMRDEARTHRVLDLSCSPELLEAPPQPTTMYRAPDERRGVMVSGSYLVVTEAPTVALLPTASGGKRPVPPPV